MPDAPNQKILRIGVIRGGKIIEEKLIRKRVTVNVGTGTRNNVVLPAANAPRSFTLFEMRGSDYYLSFTDDMTGRVSVAEQAADLQSLKAQNLVRKSGNTYQLKLSDASRGRVSIGECIILFQFVAPPPEPVRPQLPASVRGYWMRNIDWPYTSTLGTTLAVMLVLWIWAGQVDIKEEEIGIEDIPDRFAKLVMPDKPMDDIEDGDGEGAGAEVKQPKKRKKPEKAEPAGDGEGNGREGKPMTASAKRAAMEKKVAGRGLLKVLGAKGGASGVSAGGAVADVFGDGTVGGTGEGAFEGIGGLDIADAAGQRGTRGMGGATEVASVEDMGTRGVVGDAGRGTRRKSEAKVVARVSSAALQEFDSDSRSQADIKRTIRRRLGGIKHCYEKRLKRNPDLKGKIVIRFVIHPGGKVIEVDVLENTTADSALASCIAGRVRAVRFPPAEGGETVVTYPFILTPGG